jgi:hypothetical protein
VVTELTTTVNKQEFLRKFGNMKSIGTSALEIARDPLHRHTLWQSGSKMQPLQGLLRRLMLLRANATFRHACWSTFLEETRTKGECFTDAAQKKEVRVVDSSGSLQNKDEMKQKTCTHRTCVVPTI